MLDLAHFHEGDEAHWAAVVREYGPLVLGVSRGYARDGDEADDMFQEAWIRAFAKRKTFGGQGSFQAWLIVLTRNQCVSRLRSEKRRRDIARTMKLDTAEGPDDPLLAAELSESGRVLREAIARLPPRQREAIALRLTAEHTTSEIGKIMGISDPSVRSLISKGMARLAAELRPAG